MFGSWEKSGLHCTQLNSISELYKIFFGCSSILMVFISGSFTVREELSSQRISFYFSLLLERN